MHLEMSKGVSLFADRRPTKNKQKTWPVLGQVHIIHNTQNSIFYTDFTHINNQYLYDHTFRAISESDIMMAQG
jgi:hypothetical protein